MNKYQVHEVFDILFTIQLCIIFFRACLSFPQISNKYFSVIHPSQTCLFNKVIRKVTLFLTPYPLCFHPLSPFSVVSSKQGNFIKSQYEMLKLST
jgi:hypothetical protein